MEVIVVYRFSSIILDNYFTPYITVACAIGLTKYEIDTFV